MDKGSDHVSIDFKKLADSLRGTYENLYPLSEDCCIYRVPPKTRMLNESLYAPKLVSIGPIHHHGRQDLKATEEYKFRYLQQFMQRTQVRLEEFLEFIKAKEVDLRRSYADTIELESENFVQMILLDVVFLIEILLRFTLGFEGVDRIFTNPEMISHIVFDIMLIENQLPTFILQDLFKLAELKLPGRYKEYSLSQFAGSFFEYYIGQNVLVDKALLESYFSEAKHFVDLLRLCLQPTKRDDTERQADSKAAPSVTNLHQAGIKFRLASTNNLLDIRFHKGTLEIPKLIIGNMTIHLLRNLQVFESLHCDSNYINDYNIILNRLLNILKDVELLIQNEIIENRILDDEGVSTLFRELSRDARILPRNFYYSGLVLDTKNHCKSPCHRWKANLKQNYFNTPWASISVIAAVIILTLTFIQTVCSIIGL